MVEAYLTEKDEGITVYRNEEGSVYDADVPGPWCVGSHRTLIDFRDRGEKGPHDPMTAKISGTMANRDLLVTLHGDNKAYSFEWDFEHVVPGWIPVQPAKANVDVSASRLTSAPVAKAENAAVGEQMKVSLLVQQKIGVHAHLLTVMAEAPLPGKRGRSTAFYYFVQDAVDGTGLKFVTSQTGEDKKPLGSGPGDDPAASPRAKFTGSLLAGDPKLTLTIGKNVSTFVYEYHVGSAKWSKE